MLRPIEANWAAERPRCASTGWQRTVDFPLHHVTRFPTRAHQRAMAVVTYPHRCAALPHWVLLHYRATLWLCRAQENWEARARKHVEFRTKSSRGTRVVLRSARHSDRHVGMARRWQGGKGKSRCLTRFRRREDWLAVNGAGGGGSVYRPACLAACLPVCRPAGWPACRPAGLNRAGAMTAFTCHRVHTLRESKTRCPLQHI